MSKKIRLIRTMVYEYEPDPKHYPEGHSIEEMAELDAQADSRELTFSDESVTDKVTWEIVDDIN